MFKLLLRVVCGLDEHRRGSCLFAPFPPAYRIPGSALTVDVQDKVRSESRN
jgi:hypothetical protein